MKNVKRIFFLCAVIFIAFSVPALAADITFTPEGGGKWIYCNNPEGLRNQDLMNHPDYEPSYIMNNDSLTPDLYRYLVCHINCTDTDDGYGAGYDIELDIEMTAVKDTTVTINKAFFETPKDESFIFSDGTWSKEMHKVGCLNALTSFLGVNMCEQNGAWLYKAQEYESVTLEIKEGETVWLSRYMTDYSKVSYNKPVELLGEFEITEGELNVNVAAFKSGVEIGDRSGFNPKAKRGIYAYDRTQKGIADTLPKVNTNLDYTIDYSLKDGDYIVNKVYNQYEKDGYVTDVWCSHLNPQDDIWSKKIAVESDLLTMHYTDNSKLSYYGKKVKDAMKNNIWTWDTRHSDTTHYEGSVTWFANADEYYPNYELSPYRSNQGYACSMGNYAVTESYNLHVTNKTNKDKYFEYVVETVSNVAVYVEDEDGKHSGFYKGEKDAAEEDTMASVKIPANGEKTFTINLILPINYVGGIRNRFKVCDESHVGKTYEDYLKDERAESGVITYGEIAADVYDKLSDEVKKIIEGNESDYELIKTDYGYMLRYMSWDGLPYYYVNDWVKLNKIYTLDKDYKIVTHYTPDFFAQLALYYDGYYYIEDAEGQHFRTKDGLKWEAYNHRLPLMEIKFNKDKPTEWAQKEIERAYQIDAAPYDLKDQLDYDAPMTRTLFCYVLSSMLRLSDKMPDALDERIRFNDTESETIRKLATAGIISGYENGSFMPNGKITRQEAASLLSRAAEYMQNGYVAKTTDSHTQENHTIAPEASPQSDLANTYTASSGRYADDTSIGAWAKASVYNMKKMNVMQGIGENMFAPEMTYTNEQSIATILRLYDTINVIS